MGILHKYLAYDKYIRLYIVEAKDIVQEIKESQQSSREVTAGLGRLAMATLMVGALSSEEVKIYVRIEGNGPAGALYADGDAKGHVRAYARNPQVQLPATSKGKLDVGGVVGIDGELYVMKDYGMKEMQHSQSPLVSGEIAEDFAQYFAVSEQIPTAIGLGVLTNDEAVEVACGFIAQVLPGCPDRFITKLEENLQEIPSIIKFFQTHTMEEFAKALTDDTAVFLEDMPLSFECSCSKDRFIDAFYALPIKELNEMIETPEDEEIICQYCNKKYYITNDEIETIVENKK